VEADPTNIDQARAWDGDEGDYWATHADHFDRALAAYQRRLMAAVNIDCSERVLDVGCGTGRTTREAAVAARDGSARGIDLSARMIEVARRLTAEQGIFNAIFEQGDAQIHPFEPAVFDVALSRTGTMFFGDPRAAFANVGRAVRPGGRLTMLVWQGPEPNVWVRELSAALAGKRDLPGPPMGAPGPFGQADPEVVRSVLSDAGFSKIVFEGLNEPMWLGADAKDAHAFVLGLMGWMLQGLDDPGRSLALDNLRATLTAHETGRGVLFDSAAWLIQATR
jgi:SAM-dependent methyltransferase